MMSTAPSPSTPSALTPSRSGHLATSVAEAMCLAILLALPLVMNVAVARSFEASKLMAVAPMAAFCLLALLAAALGRALPPSRELLRSVPALAFLALIASAILATLASETPWVAFFGDYFRREGLVSWLVYAALFAALLLLLRHREQLERLLDVLLVASIAPCVYAVMQRYGHDFFLTQGLLVGTSAARPGGTMGNPTFLASLLLLVIPVTMARVLAVAAGWKHRLPWIAVLALQLFAVLLTQSRGPLIGLAIALFTLLLLFGARARARGLVLGAFAAALLLALGLALINFVPPLSQATVGTPLQRFVFVSTDLTLDSRVGIWRAGVDAFTHAPWWRQLIGYGPDAASFNYFNWMPANAQRNEGYSETIDRLHSEFLETLLSFGLLGLLAQIALFSSLVWAAAQRLLPIQAAGAGAPAPAGGRAAWIGYAGLLLGGMVAGAVITYLAGGGRGLWPIGAGAGLAAAWVLFFAWRTWLHLKAVPMAASDPPLREEYLLIAALISALIGSWVETQVGVPTIATRALVAAFAALLILTIAGAWRQRVAAPVPPPPAPVPDLAERKAKRKRPPAQITQPASAPAAVAWYPILGWVAGFSLIISVADFFPPLSGARMQAPSVARLELIVWPLLLTLLAALAMAGVEMRRAGADTLRGLTRFLLWSVPGPILFIVIYAKLGGAIDTTAETDLRPAISALIELSFGAYLVMACLLALALYVGDHRGEARPARAGAAGFAALATGLVLSLLTYAQMRTDFSADVGAKLGSWAQNQGRADVAADFLRESVRIMPMERRYAGSYAARLIESAAKDSARAAKEPEAAAAMRAKLIEAERVIVRARALAPRDPWLTFAYANVEQFLALKLLEKMQPPEETRRHLEEARKYMALAHEQFPGHPWILRNWAQLEMDQGNRSAAYAKLEEMEKLDPLNPTAYAEWVKLARLDNNPGAAIGALRRGLGVFPKNSNQAAALYRDLIAIPREAGRNGEAISAALEYTAAQPDRVRPWGQLAELYEISGQHELAVSNLQNAVARFAGKKLEGADAADYAALQTLAKRLTYGAAGISGAAPGASLIAPPANASVAPRSAFPGAK